MIDFLYNNPVFMYMALRLTKNVQDAEDLLQDVAEIYWSICEQYLHLSEVDKIKLGKSIMQRRFWQTLRIKKTQKRTIDEEYFIKFHKPEAFSIIELKELKNKMEKANILILLYDAMGFSNKEVATIYNLKLKGARTKLFRAKNKFKEFNKAA